MFTNPRNPGKLHVPSLYPQRDAPVTAPEEPTEISPDANADCDTYPEPSEASARKGDTATKEVNYLVLNPIVSTQTGAIEPKQGHESAQEQSDGELGTVDKETSTPETPLREATPGLAPGEETEEQVTESHSASNQDPRPDSRNEESQEEVLTKTKSNEWARIETLDHEAIRSAAMAKTAETAQEKADKTKKERGKNHPADETPAKEATPGSAPGGGTVDQAPKRSNRNFLTVDETGDVVNATWSDTPPANEKYRKNQRLLREIRKDQDQIRNKKTSQKPGHISAQEEEISGSFDFETPTREATHGSAPGGEAESKPPKTQHSKPLKNLGELTVDLSAVDLRKNKNLEPTLTKAIKRQNSEKVIEGRGNKPPKESNTTTANPKDGKANKRREFHTRKKISDAKKTANKDLPNKLVKEKPLPPPVKFIGESKSDDEDDDEIQVIAPHKIQTPKLRSPGHKSAQKPQKTKTTKSTPSKPDEGHARPPPNAPKGPTEKRKPKRPTDLPEVVVIRADTKNEDQRTERIKRAQGITRKNLIGLHRLRMKQNTYSLGKKNGNKGGPDQDAAKMSERLTLYHNVVIMPEGHAGLVRDMTIPFKTKHGETKLTMEEKTKKRTRKKDREANGRTLHVPDGQLMQHVRLQKKRFMGVGDRKHVCGHAYQLRLAQARQRLIKESVPQIKPSVIIKPKDGRRPYIRDDPRLTEALNSMNHTKRTRQKYQPALLPLG